MNGMTVTSGPAFDVIDVIDVIDEIEVVGGDARCLIASSRYVVPYVGEYYSEFNSDQIT